jgi:hypothetical protein
MGHVDGYVEGRLVAAEEQNDIEKYSDFEEFDALYKEAHKLVDEKGDQFYREQVEGVNYDANGERSRGFLPQGAIYDRDGNLRWEPSMLQATRLKEQQCIQKTT